MNKRYQPEGAMPSSIEIFNPNRELTQIGNLNRRWTQIYADKDQPRMDANVHE